MFGKILSYDNFTAEKLTNSQLVVANISKREIQNRDLKNVLGLISVLEDCGTAGRGKVIILFDGYNDTPKEIFEIPEIRKWVKALITAKPYLFYFINNF